MSISVKSRLLSRLLHCLKAVQSRHISVYKHLNLDSVIQNNCLLELNRITRIQTVTACNYRNSSCLSNCTSHINFGLAIVISNRQYSQKAENKFTLRNDAYKEYLNHLEQEFHRMDEQRSTGAGLGEKSQRWFAVKRVMEVYEEIKVKYEELEELTEMLKDEEMKEDAEREKEKCLTEIDELEENLVDILCPEEEFDDRDIVMEIESGAGGQEAMLFAEEIYAMYQNYALYKGWEFTPTKSAKCLSATISGEGVYGMLKYESGVHRVQRVPKTERQGRIHTSTISVAIYPQPTEIDIVLDPKDLRIDAFRSSGPGGQNAHVTDSAVRVKHIPTGITVENQSTRTQLKNKELALAELRRRLYQKQVDEQMKQITSQRKMQVGNKDRSEKIRTYNFPQNRVTDHRLGHTVHSIDMFVSGNEKLDSMMQYLIEEANKENLVCLIDDFKNSQIKKKVRK